MRVVAGVAGVMLLAGIALGQGMPGSHTRNLPAVGKLPEPRQMHAATVLGKRLYVLGGELKPVTGNNNWTETVLSAEIMPNGFLGQFRSELPMPERRAYIHACTEVVNDRIYVVAGTIAPQPSTPDAQIQRAGDVLWTRVQADGTLSPWQRSTPFPEPTLSVAVSCSNDEHLYILGGSTSGNVLDRILVCDFAPDGAPVNWREITPLPSPLWFQGAAILDQTLYVWGGLPARETAAVNANVYAATVNRDGTLGQWRTEASKMPYPVYGATFCGFNDYLVSAAGRYPSAVTHNAIWYARMNAGTVGQWQYILTDLDTRIYHALGLDRSRGVVYIVGGRFKSKEDSTGYYVDAVRAFVIPQPESSRLTVATATGPGATAAAGTPSAATPAVASAGTGAALTLPDLPTALQQAGSSGKQVLAFFYSPEVPASKRAAEAIVQNPQFAAATSQMIVAGVDLARGNTEFSYKYGVFKVPAFALLQGNGTLVRKTTRLNSFADLQSFLAGN